MPAQRSENDDNLLDEAGALSFGENTRSVMVGCMIVLLIEGVIVLVMHTTWGRVLEGTLLTGAASL